MKSLAVNPECWIDEDNRILSFHFVKEYIHKQFVSYSEFMRYAVSMSRKGFKVQ